MRSSRAAPTTGYNPLGIIADRGAPAMVTLTQEQQLLWRSDTLSPWCNARHKPLHNELLMLAERGPANSPRYDAGPLLPHNETEFRVRHAVGAAVGRNPPPMKRLAGLLARRRYSAARGQQQ